MLFKRLFFFSTNIQAIENVYLSQIDIGMFAKWWGQLFNTIFPFY